MNRFIFTLAALFACLVSTPQNKYEETIPYEDIGGFIVLPVNINGKEYKFIFDPLTQPAILDEYAGEAGFVRNDIPVPFRREGIESLSGGRLTGLCIGKNIFAEKTGALIIRNDYLKSIGVAGIINASPFVGYVLTIDSRNNTITTSTPYKPGYISLRNQVQLVNKAEWLVIDINGHKIEAALDLAGGKQVITLSEADFDELQQSLNITAGDVPVTRTPSYFPAEVMATEALAAQVTIANTVIPNTKVFAVKGNSFSAIGAGLLEKGIISLDYVKGRLFFQSFDTVDDSKITPMPLVPDAENTGSSIINLTRLNFGELIFDYRTKSEWKYKGEKPAIIDFWAPWCGPCKRISPILEKLAKQYKDEIVIYKLNTDDEPEIAKYFNATALPLLLYIPLKGEPVRVTGALPEETILEKISTVLLTPGN